MKEIKVLLLAGNTLRSRSYCQTLEKIPNIEVCGILYGFGKRTCQELDIDNATYEYLYTNQIKIPDFRQPVESVFYRNDWKYSVVENDDVNAQEVLFEIARHSPDIVVFSGYGGQILSKEHFKTHIRYLHMHPGWLPDERGSTTIYYSILNKKNISVTAFYMTAEIDAGEDVVKKQYPIPNGIVNIDQWIDNCVRADCMASAFESILKNDLTPTNNSANNTEYYIIHPLLKHIALLSLDK